LGQRLERTGRGVSGASKKDFKYPLNTSENRRMGGQERLGRQKRGEVKRKGMIGKRLEVQLALWGPGLS